MFRLSLIFIAFKVLQVAILWFTPGQFDISSEVILANYTEDAVKLPQFFVRLAEKHLVWDNIYYIHLAHDGPQFEHEYVFSPGWWRVIRYVCATWLQTNNFYILILIGVLVSNLCQYLACIELYWYSKVVFRRIPLFKHKTKLCYFAALSYIFSPGGVFLTTSYSENISSLTAITGLFLRELSLDYKIQYRIRSKIIYVLSGLIIGLSYSFRANCLLLGVFYLFDLFKFLQSQNPTSIVTSILGGLPLFFNFVQQAVYNYTQFCPERGEWCQNRIPLLFSYAQSKYWDNGFLKYWTPNNIPNFIVALPVIILNFNSCKHFLIRYPVQSFVPYIILNCLLLLSGILFLNVQILNRILNFNPLFYWYLAVLIDQPAAVEDRSDGDKSWKNVLKSFVSRFSGAEFIFTGFIMWILIQTALFAAFLPPA